MVSRKRQSTISFRVQTNKVDLPTGPLGVKFVGTPPVITEVSSESPLAGKLTVGKFVEKVTIPNVIESECLDGADAEYLLSESDDVEGRILFIKADAVEYNPIGRSAKVYIPKGDGPGLGLRYERGAGDDPIIGRIDPKSALGRRVTRGQLVYQFSRVQTTTGETQIVDVRSAKALNDVLKFTEGKRTRVLLLQNIDFKMYRASKRKFMAFKATILLAVAGLVYFLVSEGIGLGF